jgi:hypothetical protein
MGNQLLPQNEFFIYVPSLQSDKLDELDELDELDAHDEDEKNNMYVEAVNLPVELRAWVKVPLAGTVCVYVSPSLAYREVSCPS